MYVISFQGVCYFQRPPSGGVVVHLPKCPESIGKHLDETEARPHYARVFCRKEAVDEQLGFCPATASVMKDGDMTTIDGYQFELEDAKSPFGYRILVTPQGGAINRDSLRAHVPSFSEFAGGLPFEPKSKLAAQAVLNGGYFDFRLSPYVWNLNKRLHHSDKDGVKALGRPCWAVDWYLSSPLEDLEIRIFDGLIQVGAVCLRETSDPRVQVIIGNLDQQNSALWPLREEMTVEECEEDGCPDNDFKWLYQLFNEDAVRARLEERRAPDGTKELSVPVLASAPSLDTPTCFPGGD